MYVGNTDFPQPRPQGFSLKKFFKGKALGTRLDFPENIFKKIIQNSKENGRRDPLRVTTPKSAYEMGKLGFLLCQTYIGHSCYESLKVS